MHHTDSYIEVHLSAAERSVLAMHFNDIEHDLSGSDGYVSDLRKAAYHAFPDSLLDILDRQRSSIAPRALIAIHGLPIDSTVTGSPAPGERADTYKNGHCSEKMLTALSSLIGEPYSILSEGDGYVANLTPERSSRHAFDINGSEVELDYHIENAALRFLALDDCSPLGVALIGVRHEPATPLTRFADVRLALSLLSPDDIDALYGNNFIIKLPHRWRGAFFGNVEHTGPCSLLTGPRSLPRASGAFYKDITHALNEGAQRAFGNLHSALRNVERTVDVRPGTFVYVDNRFAFHARDRFVSAYDANDRPLRWLQRVYVAPNLWNFRSFKRVGGRVFDPSTLVE